jgi:hypothetical protein
LENGTKRRKTVTRTNTTINNRNANHDFFFEKKAQKSTSRPRRESLGPVLALPPETLSLAT